MPPSASSSSRGRMRGLRDVPLERVLFVVVLGFSALLLSVVMLRSEQATGVTKAAPRTFRDGFTVAQESRRAESNGTATNAAMALSLEEKAVPETGTATGQGTQVQVEKQGEHTMTKIKTEDGDEITIKRAANSNKITTISAHEDGKITIENREDSTKKMAKTEKDETIRSAPAVKVEAFSGIVAKQQRAKEEMDEERTRRAGYEKIALGKEPAMKVLRVEDGGEELSRRTEAEETTSEEEPKKNKKVTVVEVGRSLTKVSVHEVKEDKEEEEEEEEKEHMTTERLTSTR